MRDRGLVPLVPGLAARELVIGPEAIEGGDEGGWPVPPQAADLVRAQKAAWTLMPVGPDQGADLLALRAVADAEAALADDCTAAAELAQAVRAAAR